jgi:hypothetical protein
MGSLREGMRLEVGSVTLLAVAGWVARGDALPLGRASANFPLTPSQDANPRERMGSNAWEVGNFGAMVRRLAPTQSTACPLSEILK